MVAENHCVFFFHFLELCMAWRSVFSVLRVDNRGVMGGYLPRHYGVGCVLGGFLSSPCFLDCIPSLVCALEKKLPRWNMSERACLVSSTSGLSCVLCMQTNPLSDHH